LAAVAAASIPPRVQTAVADLAGGVLVAEDADCNAPRVAPTVLLRVRARTPTKTSLPSVPATVAVREGGVLVAVADAWSAPKVQATVADLGGGVLVAEAAHPRAPNVPATVADRAGGTLVAEAADCRLPRVQATVAALPPPIE